MHQTGLRVSRTPASGKLADVLGLQPLRTLHHFEFHLLAFRQRTEPLRLDGRVVAEDVLASAILGDEAIALRVVEPLHGTSRHSKQSFLFGCSLQAGPELYCWWRASFTGNAARWSREHPVSDEVYAPAPGRSPTGR